MASAACPLATLDRPSRLPHPTLHGPRFEVEAVGSLQAAFDDASFALELLESTEVSGLEWMGQERHQSGIKQK